MSQLQTEESVVQMKIDTRDRLDKLRGSESYDSIMNKIIDCYEKYSAPPFDCDLRCPNCNGFKFFIYREPFTSASYEIKDIAACINCETDTSVVKLKRKYHKDKSKDFKVRCTRLDDIIYECDICHMEEHTDCKTFWYEDVIFSYPEPQWKCPKHPNSKVHESHMNECTSLIDGSPYGRCKQHPNEDPVIHYSLDEGKSSETP